MQRGFASLPNTVDTESQALHAPFSSNLGPSGASNYQTTMSPTSMQNGSFEAGMQPWSDQFTVPGIPPSSGATFGVDLGAQLQRDGMDVPRVVEKCAETIEAKGQFRFHPLHISRCAVLTCDRARPCRDLQTIRNHVQSHCSKKRAGQE
jgi:hypothetical protein